MMTVNADPYGRGSADPDGVKLKMFPGAKESVDEFKNAIINIHKSGLITVYDTIIGKCYQVNQWDRFQTFNAKNRGIKGRFPENTNVTVIHSDSQTITDDHRQEVEVEVELEVEVKESLSQHHCQNGDPVLTVAVAIYEHYLKTVRPIHANRQLSLKYIKRIISNDGHSRDLIISTIDAYVESFTEAQQENPQFRARPQNFFSTANPKYIQFLEKAAEPEEEIVYGIGV